MTYFSRLTDIVTCNLSDFLSREADPSAALERILAEMHEGLGGARRSVQTALAHESRLRREIDEHRPQMENWLAEARRALGEGSDDEARLALVRKQEVEDLIGGLEQQLQAAVSTKEHLTTTLRALEARIAEAERKRETLRAGGTSAASSNEAPRSASAASPLPADPDRARQIEAELDRLRREVGKA
ncbi:MAG: PspA/IM30 family protein [Planctomycetaceae bacterium]